MSALVHSQVIHALIAIISFYMFILFAWWGHRQGRITIIYGFTCFLMLGIFLTHFGEWHVYNEMLQGHTVTVIEQYWWPFKSYIQVLSLVAYAVYMTGRALYGWGGDGIYGRRNGDL